MPSIQLIPSTDVNILVPLLRDAEEGDERIVQAIAGPSTVAYIAQDDDQPVGAVVVRWSQDESEIIYIATLPSVRGLGYGKAIIRGVVEEAKKQSISAVYVGTANTSWDNIAFYQKCGFRMDSVRKDYFDYFPTPLYEGGIQMRDMLMLRLAIVNP